MAWIYLAELADLRQPSMDMSDHSFIVSQTDIARQCSCPINNREFYHARRYGMTCERCNMTIFPQWILSTEASHARISLSQELRLAWGESEADYFSRSFAWPKKSSPSSYSLKMFQELGNGLLTLGCHLPTSAMIVDGILYPLKKLVRHLKEKDGSAWPRATMASRAGYNQGGGSGRQGRKRYPLKTLWKMGRLPRPMARESRSAGTNSEMNRNTPSLSGLWKATTGTNMPASCFEWMMGYPIDHTVLKPWAMQWFRSKRGKPL